MKAKNIATTQDQSQRLLRCGVSADTADMHFDMDEERYKGWRFTGTLLKLRKYPAWSLSALLTKVLPSNIKCGAATCLLEIISSDWQSEEQTWEVLYGSFYDMQAPDPIEACVLMAEKLTANGYKLNGQ